MTIAVRQSAIGHSNAAATTATFGSATLAGSLILAITTDGGLFAPTVTDNKSGGSSSYTQMTGVYPSAYTTGSNSNTAVYVNYLENCAAGIGTLTSTQSTGNATSFIILEITGAVTSGSLDSGALATSKPAASSSPTTNGVTSGTLAQANELVVFIAGSASTALTVAWSVAGATMAQAETDQNDYWPGAVATQRSTSTTGLTGTFTLTGSGTQNLNLVAIAFKEAAGSLVLGAVTATGSLGSTLGVGAQLNLSGNSSATAPGTVKANVQLALTGVSSATSVGSVAVPGGPTVATAVTSTGSPGTAKANAQLNLSGNSATSGVSNVVPGLGATLSGNSTSSSVTGLGGNFNVPLTPVQATVSVGSVSVSIPRPIAAVSSTTSVGSAGVNVAVALTGVSSTCTVGTLQPPGNQLSPVSCTGAVGSLGLTVSHALSAVSSASTPGSVKSTPQPALTGVGGTGSVGSVTFGNVVVGLTGVSSGGTVGNLAPPATPDFKNGEIFFAQQMAIPFGYQNQPVAQRQRGAIFYASGTWTVPPGAGTIFCSASAGGGTPLGNAGDQSLQGTLSAVPGDVLTVTMNPNGEVYVTKGATQLLFLRAGAAYGKIAWQSTWGQNSGLPGAFGSGVDAGTPFPPILVFYWTP